MTFESEIHISHPNLDDKPEINNTEIIDSTDKLIKRIFSFGPFRQSGQQGKMFSILLK